MPGRDHLPSSMQERSSFKTEFQALPGEKEPREETLARSLSAKGVCLREEEFLTIEKPMVASTSKTPLATDKPSLKLNLPLNQMAPVSQT